MLDGVPEAGYRHHLPSIIMVILGTLAEFDRNILIIALYWRHDTIPEHLT